MNKIVISGLVGGFPGNATLDEFYHALLAGRSTTEAGATTPVGPFPPPYMPRGPNATADPIELSIMAMMDAGINPYTLRHTNTGIYHTIDRQHGTNDSASRATYELFLKGPAVGLKCCSGFIPLDMACRAIAAGECDSAIVIEQTFQGSKNDKITCVALYVCRERDAKRVYAEIQGTAVNGNGLWEHGIQDGTEGRDSLYLRAYERAGVDAKAVGFLSQNSWSTVDKNASGWDPQKDEGFEKVAEVFCKERSADNPLYVAAVSSVDEKLPGLAAIATLILSNLNGTIPGSSASAIPNPDPGAVESGHVKQLESNTPWPANLVALTDFRNSSAGHVILSFEGIERRREFFPSDLPILIPFAARYPKILGRLFPAVASTPDHGIVALMHQLTKQHLQRHAFRGYALNHPRFQSKNEIVTEALLIPDTEPEILLVMTGMGSQWPGMGRELMRIPVFAESIQKADTLLAGKLPLRKLIEAGELGADKFVAPLLVTCIQLALVNLMRSLGVQPTAIVGHSTGEMASAYADGCLTFEETVALVTARTDSLREAQLSGGSMAAVSLSWQEALQRVPQGVVPACNNAANNVTVSGRADAVGCFVNQLKNQGTMAVPVNTDGIAYHSEYMEPAKVKFEQRLKEIFGDKKLVQKSWICSSLERPTEAKGKEFTVVEYFVNNMRSPVRFKEALDLVSTDAIVVELGPHSLLQSLITRRFKKDRIVGLTNRTSEDQIFHLFQSLGKLFNAGANLDLSAIYPAQFPLRCRTPNLSSFIK